MAINLKYKRTCAVCGLEFMANQEQTKSCSSECRKKRTERFPSYDKLIPTGTAGAITELKIASDLMERRYSVFRAVSPSCFCDLIAIKNKTILNIECRTGYETMATNGVAFLKDTHGEIDCFAVYTHHNKKISYFKEDGKTIKRL